MGDRVLIQVIADDRVSPVAYGHWCGRRTPEIIKRLRERIEGRLGDADYTFARLIQEMVDGDTGNLSFGVWNADPLTTPDGSGDQPTRFRIIDAGDSHGDAGVVVINVSRGFRCTCAGGYLKTHKKTGLPYIPRENG